ncbi:Uncharacterised protein [Vibrio cholerae]|uniref:Uncharacterized protein n=1 Tax=Vibrio cholerae TaxID=666 RepID=A0A656APW1_VIBCL|nr:Uncharacterised protein [Vibrio cholerae]CSD25852.1 Uncharacterised protein [Vibrio cholerae]
MVIAIVDFEITKLIQHCSLCIGNQGELTSIARQNPFALTFVKQIFTAAVVNRIRGNTEQILHECYREIEMTRAMSIGSCHFARPMNHHRDLQLVATVVGV